MNRESTAGAPPKLLIATRNEGKLREIVDRLKDLPIRTISLADLDTIPDCHEDGTSFLENALKKSKHFMRFSGLPALADDSGLMIDSLGGLPGIRSARFAGHGATDEQRVAKVLEMMKGVPTSQRQASFVCALVCSWSRDDVYEVEERVQGIIALEPSGNEGFGYDPIFEVPSIGKTLAQLDPSEKARISHRAKALSRFRQNLIATLPLRRSLHEN